MTALEKGRDAFRHRSWEDAYRELSAADGEATLAGEDIERLADAAALTGREEASADLRARAHAQYLKDEDIEGAARAGFWLAYGLLNRGEFARAGGWLARTRRLLDDTGIDTPIRGFLLLPTALEQFAAADYAGARGTFQEATRLGSRFHAVDLVAIARHGEGRACIRQGQVGQGIALIDEVMVSVTTGEVSPLVAGDVYCSVLSACHEIFDLRRAREWTSALTRWCESQPGLVAYRSQCLIRRAELLQLHGAWNEAMAETRQALARLTEPPDPAVLAAAWYQQAELHRVRGELEAAAEAYRETVRWGKSPEPGETLLRLAQGQIQAARTAIGRVLAEVREPRKRSGALAASVEVLLAAGDVPGARASADELARIAAALEAPLLRAMAEHAVGSVLLAEGRCDEALARLRRAADLWRSLDAPYDTARTGVLIGLGCRALGDEAGGGEELTAAAAAFGQLGAAGDLAALEQLRRSPEARGSAPRLTAREREVLALLATGSTNRAIAEQLGLSERTVARHLSNIFPKIGVSTRSAATAWAYRRGLIS
jgi:DNA-binding CsgD family transcriptional regulator